MANAKLADVARAAGVSLTTVGRVLHGGYVSEDKRERVEKAVKELGYVPNKMAQSLKMRESRMIGNLMRFNPNLLYEQISKGIGRAAGEKGYGVYAVTDYDGNVENQIDELIARKVDAVVIISFSSVKADEIAKITAAGIPVVMVERTQNIPGVDRVVINDIGGAYDATTALIKNGRTNISFVGVKPLDKTVELERRQGYEKALTDAGIEICDSYIREAESYGPESGYKAAKSIYESGARPDGFFCTSDLLASGVMQYLYEKSISIPDEVAIVGYDDTISHVLAPKISSVGLDAEKIGDCVMDMILTRLKDKEMEPREARIDTVFVDRFN